MTGLGRAIATGVLAVCVAACGGATNEHRFTAGSTTVVDASTLVTGVTDGAPATDEVTGELPVVANPNGSLTSIAVYWRNPGCSPGATLSLGGNALQLMVTRQPSPSDCSTPPHNDAVTLKINRVVDVTSIGTKSGD